MLQVILIAERIHRMPEIGVPVGGELPFPRQGLQRLPFPKGVITLDIYFTRL
jgi:hypothetical protein